MKIQIISFSFPPQPGVGGRRWAKFAKYFHRSGHDVRIVAATPLSEGSPWSKDIQAYQGHVSFVDTHFPIALRTFPGGLLGRLQYRWALMKMRWQSKGNPFDHSLHWHRSLLPVVKQNLADGYTTVIASGGPFHYLYELSQLKKSLGSELRLICDFRDPWSNNEMAFGFRELSSERLQVEQEKERAVITRSDAVVSVAAPMTEYFRNIGASPEKTHTIINGFDPEDIPTTEISARADELRAVFVGTLYDNCHRHVIEFSKAISRWTQTSKTPLSFHFYGDMNPVSKDVLNRCPSVTVHPKVSLPEAQQLLSEATLGLLFLTDDLTYSMSTKCCEYFAHQLPILCISNHGQTPDFILENNLGWHCRPDAEEIYQWLQQAESMTTSKKKAYQSFDSRPFDVQHLAQRYLQLLEGLDGHG